MGNGWGIAHHVHAARWPKSHACSSDDLLDPTYGRSAVEAETPVRILTTVLRGATVKRTYDTHKNLPGIYLSVFTITGKHS